MPFPINPALEAAVIADADDDLPRLVYADWLEENGDPNRAAFIRLQCALWDKSPADADYPDLVEAHREACDRMTGRRDIAPVLPDGMRFHHDLSDPDDELLFSGYRRGFPYYVTPDNHEQFRAALPTLVGTTTIRGIDDSLYGQDELRELCRTLSDSAIGRFSALSLRVMDNDRESGTLATAISRSPASNSLRWLDVALEGENTARALAAADFRDLFRWDAGSEWPCSAPVLNSLLGTDWFARLHHLNCGFKASQAKSVWSALRTAPELHTVHLSGWKSSGVLATLGTVGPLRSLGRLVLGGSRLTTDDVTGLARARLPRLASLGLPILPRGGWKQLPVADWFAGLRTLELGGLDDDGVIVLGRSPVAASLRSLTLARPMIGRAALDTLSANFPNLTTLHVILEDLHALNRFEVERFLTRLSLPRLRHLTLNNCPVGDSGAIALAENTSLRGLTRLDLDYAAVGDAGVRAIFGSPRLRGLVHLRLRGCDAGEAMRELIDPDVLPNLACCWLPLEVSRGVYDALVAVRGPIFYCEPPEQQFG